MNSEQKLRNIFKNNLTYQLDINNMTQVELAELLNVTPAAVNTWIKGIKLPRLSKVDKMCEIFNVTRSDLMDKSDENKDFADEVAKEFLEIMNSDDYKISTEELIKQYSNLTPIRTKRIPMLGDIACGEPIFTDEDRESYVEVGTDIKADFCLRAKGDSMIGARILDGDIVFIRRQSIVDNGDIAAVVINEEATLKRVNYNQEHNTLILLAENPAFPPMVYQNEELENIYILGKAIALQTDIK